MLKKSSYRGADGAKHTKCKREGHLDAHYAQNFANVVDVFFVFSCLEVVVINQFVGFDLTFFYQSWINSSWISRLLLLVRILSHFVKLCLFDYK